MNILIWVFLVALVAAMGLCFYGMDGRSPRLVAIGGGAWAGLALIAVVVVVVRAAT